jgi:hypothetical protein
MNGIHMSYVDSGSTDPLVIKSYDSYNRIFAQISFKIQNLKIVDGLFTSKFVALLTSSGKIIIYYEKNKVYLEVANMGGD